MGALVVRECPGEERAWVGFRWEPADGISLHNLPHRRRTFKLLVCHLFLFDCSGNSLSLHMSFC